MATYVSLLRYTQQGIQHIKESPARLDAARQLWRPTGGESQAFYLVMGEYEAVLISQAPADATMAQLVLPVGSRRADRSEAVRRLQRPSHVARLRARFPATFGNPCETLRVCRETGAWGIRHLGRREPGEMTGCSPGRLARSQNRCCLTAIGGPPNPPGPF